MTKESLFVRCYSNLKRGLKILHREGIKTFLHSAKKLWDTYPPITQQIYNQYWKLQHGEGTSVLDKDWDNLIILDACRYDTFCEAQSFTDNSIPSRISLGSNTTEFLKRNFLGKELYNTIYITANPKPLKLENGDYGDNKIFYKIHSLLDQFDENTKTVHPEVVIEESLKVHKEHPNKRLILHFNQPHKPYLGKKEKSIQQQLNTGPKWSMKKALRDGSITQTDVREAYKETLVIALEEINGLLTELNGRTMITSDHGEMFGEKPFAMANRIYEHPKRTRTNELCRVPYLIMDNKERRLVVANDPEDAKNIDMELINERLDDLGYK